MKALVYTGPKQVELQDFPDPVAGDGDLQVRIDAVGICGSDMHAFLGHDDRRPAPLILGHEAAGTVLGGPEDGRRVVVNPLVTCGKCRDCRADRPNLCPNREIISMPPRQGAFAERITIPERNLIDIPENLDAGKAALAEPLATSWHTVRLAETHSVRPLSETHALVFGGGAVGLGAALALKAFGCKDVAIAETNPLRRQTAEAAGITRTLDPTAPDALTPGSADIVIDAVGNQPTRAAAIETASPGGVIVHVGLADGSGGFDARRLTLQEITFVGSYTYTMEDFHQTVAAMAEGALGDLAWYEERPFAVGPQAFQDLLDGKAGAAKIVLKLDAG